MNSKTNTILIVDDDLYIRESLKEILDDDDYRLMEAADGKIALDIISEQSIDLILLDLELPRISGLIAVTFRHSTSTIRVITIPN